MFTSLFLKMLNREATSRRSRPEEILEQLNIRAGQVIADIGSGGGYFTLATQLGQERADTSTLLTSKRSI